MDNHAASDQPQDPRHSAPVGGCQLQRAFTLRSAVEASSRWQVHAQEELLSEAGATTDAAGMVEQAAGSARQHRNRFAAEQAIHLLRYVSAAASRAQLQPEQLEHFGFIRPEAPSTGKNSTSSTTMSHAETKYNAEIYCRQLQQRSLFLQAGFGCSPFHKPIDELAPKGSSNAPLDTSTSMTLVKILDLDAKLFPLPSMLPSSTASSRQSISSISSISSAMPANELANEPSKNMAQAAPKAIPKTASSLRFQSPITASKSVGTKRAEADDPEEETQEDSASSSRGNSLSNSRFNKRFKPWRPKKTESAEEEEQDEDEDSHASKAEESSPFVTAKQQLIMDDQNRKNRTRTVPPPRTRALFTKQNDSDGDFSSGSSFGGNVPKNQATASNLGGPLTASIGAKRKFVSPMLKNSKISSPSDENTAPSRFVDEEEQIRNELKHYNMNPPVMNKRAKTSTSSNSNEKGDPTNSKLHQDERLKGLEPKMIDLIMNEIMDRGPKVTWDDIAGLAHAKKTIKEIIIWPMLRPDIFTGLCAPPKGVLLFGPPGTGKTMIGKCIASQAGATFFSISASSLTSKWVGEGEKMVRTLFAVARVLQPSVIFIDEIDSLLTQRTDNEVEASRKIKTEFLVQFDGCGAATEGERLLVVGATNRPHEIDEAARRRLSKRLLIPLPDQEARSSIIKNLCGKQKNSLGDGDIETIAKRSDGYSGSDMALLCSEAAMGPIRELVDIMDIKADAVRPMGLRDFEYAFTQVRASVSCNDLKMYETWNKEFGSLS